MKNQLPTSYFFLRFLGKTFKTTKIANALFQFTLLIALLIFVLLLIIFDSKR